MGDVHFLGGEDNTPKAMATEVLACLHDAINYAEAEGAQSVVVIMEDRDGHFRKVWAGLTSSVAVIGALELMKARIVEHMIAREDAQ